MKKYWISGSALLFAILLAYFSQTKVRSAVNKPNIVTIMTDDLCVGMLDIAIKNGFMPNLKKFIINRGTTFTNSFVSNSLCCPSRSTFLTGQYSHNHQVLDNELPTGGVTRLDDSKTLPVWLKAQNYRTGLIGKYLNGYGGNRTSSPKDDSTYIPPGWDDWQAIAREPQNYDYKISDNGVVIAYGSNSEDYLTDVLAQRAKDFIRESSELNPHHPFFLWITPYAPHSEDSLPPCHGSARDYGDIRPAPRHIGTASTIPLPMPGSLNENDIGDKPIWYQNSHPPLKHSDLTCLRKVYQHKLEALRAVDDLIGTVVQELKQVKNFDKTVLIFTSDNGYLFGEHRAEKKRYVYEPSIRVPLYIRLPGQATLQTQNNLVLNNDLAPTIANWAGATPDIMVDGRSLLPLFGTSVSSTWRQQFLVENYVDKKTLSPFAAIRTADSLLYVEHTQGGKEFYNLTKDPEELHSLHDQSPPRLPELQNLLAQLQLCKGSTCRDLEDSSPTAAKRLKSYRFRSAITQPQLKKLQLHKTTAKKPSRFTVEED